MHLLGVRGSTPAPGPAFVRYGGHTSCVAVAADDSPMPTLVLDAGTGLRNLGALLGDAPYRGTILLTHLHWDHLHGLPFTPSVDRVDAEVDLRLPAQGWRTAKALLGRAMSPPSFPIGVDGLRGRWRTSRLQPGLFDVEGFTVMAAEIPHKGGRTFGYRISADGASIAYLPDHVLAGGPTPAAMMLAEGVDVLLHDASNAAGDRAAATCFGHSTVDDAVAFAREARVRQLVLTHHAPSRTDDELDRIVSGLDVSGLDVVVGWEGAVLHAGCIREEQLIDRFGTSSRHSVSGH
jgi:phosphoribosyl 1,2-cyclic phosphodiesterase